MTSTADEDLDAGIWMAMKVYKVTTTEPLLFIESVRVLARAYAASDTELLTQARRMVLHEETRPRRRRRPQRAVVVPAGGGSALAMRHKISEKAAK